MQTSFKRRKERLSKPKSKLKSLKVNATEKQNIQAREIKKRLLAKYNSSNN